MSSIGLFQSDYNSKTYKSRLLGRGWGLVIIKVYFDMPIAIIIYLKNRTIIKIKLCITVNFRYAYIFSKLFFQIFLVVMEEEEVLSTPSDVCLNILI